MLLTVGRYFDPWEAHILRARLEAEGIPASVARATFPTGASRLSCGACGHRWWYGD
ncbi:DUF2007 domain-containing protein [Lysobacter silvisoli]|uniref:DUF2007 domain-containing protein n=1 Tax=Lysobacter silvisoli TaxID=2293254 RepID=UPI0011C05A72|nr:DUF2007 domain-containing protein [Lysobacter silvisoli]